MPRNLFPTDGDRRVIERFLLGMPNPIMDDTPTSLVIHEGKLAFTSPGHDASTSTVIAWYDTAGALCAVPGTDWWLIYSSKACDAIAEMMNLPDRFQQEWEPTGDLKRRVYFFGDRRVDPGSPYVIAGALSVAAWRASRSKT